MINDANTVWILIATALVFFMTIPGLALFYGGMVRARNVITTFMQCYAVACVIMVLWYLVGYSVAYGSDVGGFIGGFDRVALIGVTLDSTRDALPEILFFAYQMTFAIITAVILVGAFAERVKFTFVLLFSALWSVLVYAPVAHWVWGGGMLSDGGLLGATGVRDYAGGLVVHQTAGVAALVLAVAIGPRKYTDGVANNSGLVMIGAAMLWFGWLGFNGGSGLAADATAAMAVTVTMISAATASLSWMLWEYIKTGKVSLIGLVTGTLCGLAAITPASGYVGPAYAMMIGAIAGMMCHEAVSLLRKLGIDDSLDVFAVHGFGGIYGSIMIAPLGVATWTAQLGGIAIITVYTLVATSIILFFCKGVAGLRVSDDVEQRGLDSLLSGLPSSETGAAHPATPPQTPQI